MRRLSHLLSLSSKMPFSYSSTVKIVFVYLALLSCLSVYLGSAVAAATGGGGAIPADAIRIRIISNSDAAFDQQVKLDVRDQVAGMIESWGAMPATHDEARSLIAAHLAEIQAVSDRVLRSWNVDYSAAVTLADVPFPEKMFGGREYAAGDYEALRITLGGGLGANWWCVLFPPLCLTAATASEQHPAKPSGSRSSVATGARAEQVKGQGQNRTGGKASASAHTKVSDDAARTDVPADAGENGKPKARFFLWELLQKLGAFLEALFA